MSENFFLKDLSDFWESKEFFLSAYIGLFLSITSIVFSILIIIDRFIQFLKVDLNETFSKGKSSNYYNYINSVLLLVLTIFLTLTGWRKFSDPLDPVINLVALVIAGVSSCLLSFSHLPHLNKKNSISGFTMASLFPILILMCLIFAEIFSSNKTTATYTTTSALKSTGFAISVLAVLFACFFPCHWIKMNKKYEWPAESVNLFSRFAFIWLYPIMWTAYKFGINLSNTCVLNEQNQPKQVYEKIMTSWGSRRSLKSDSSKSLWYFMWSTFKREFFISISMRFLVVVTFFGFPLFNRLFISFYKMPNCLLPECWKGYFSIFFILISYAIESTANNHFFQYTFRIQQRFNFGVMKLIYVKSLKTSSSARQKDDVFEKITNFISNDIPGVTTFCIYLPFLVITPIELGLFLFYLYQLIGVAVFVGFGAMCFMLCLTVFCFLQSSKLLEKITFNQDKRIKIMNDILNGIKIIKLYAWENHFLKLLLSYRKKEANYLKSESRFYAGMTLMWNLSAQVLIIASFFYYKFAISNQKYKEENLILALYLLNMIRVPISLLPLILSSLNLTINSFKRLANFLNLPERGEDSYISKENLDSENSLIIKKSSYSWGGDSNFTLNKIALKVPRGQLIGIAGRVGSGKTSFFSTLLGELKLIYDGTTADNIQEKIFIDESIGYVAQVPWIQSRNVRQNILFFEEFDRSFYNKVLNSCSIMDDLKLLASGDMTQIGEKGINLSGGQRQRISLARAVYAKKDLYILDDPLSAVDVHVGQHIFKNVISNEGMLGKKTRLFATNNPAFLAQCDRIIVFENGNICADGDYSNISNSFDFIKNYSIKSEEKPESHSKPHIMSPKRVSILLNRITAPETNIAEFDDGVEKTGEKKVDKFFTGENVQLGQVSFSVISNYFKQYGYIVLGLILFTFILSSSLQVTSNLMLFKWISKVGDITSPNNSDSHINLIFMYLGFGLGFLFVSALFYALITIGTERASKGIHFEMITKLIHWPLSQFEKTPIGRVLNKFSKDLFTLDYSVPKSFSIFNLTLIGMISIYFEIMIIEPIMIVPIVFVTISIFLLHILYSSANRQFGRLEVVARSPILNQFSESFQGSTTISAMNAFDNVNQRFDSSIAIHLRWWMHYVCTNRWISAVLDIHTLICFAVAIGYFMYKHGSINSISDPNKAQTLALYATKIGYILSNYRNIGGIYVWFIRMIADFQVNIQSMERIIELKSTPDEGLWYNDSLEEKLVNWPTEGNLKFENMSFQYRQNLPCVLSEINLDIKGGMRVGVCGRTGAGKSTLISALFRTVNPTKGAIYIDDIDICKLGLQQLRQKLSIIPQDPVIFETTLRNNIDPMGNSTDDELWMYLELCNLKSIFDGSENGLDSNVSEDSFSLGQKQLLCLVRALLRKSKILMLDEATASVDLETDRTIQSTIKNQFKNTTIITIAHRLQTIIDYDKIVVLNKGKIEEVGTPQELLDKRETFYGMCKEAGLVE